MTLNGFPREARVIGQTMFAIISLRSTYPLAHLTIDTLAVLKAESTDALIRCHFRVCRILIDRQFYMITASSLEGTKPKGFFFLDLKKKN